MDENRTTTLTIQDHRRDAVGLTYVYPVVSRRAGGVSVGINLNPNNACNWRCLYCQVPDLVRGSAPAIDLTRLEGELRGFLADLVHGDYLQRHAPPEARVIRDVAFSGNGEPTTAREFPQVVGRVVALMAEFGLLPEVKLRLITNGSMVDRAAVQEGLRAIAQAGGEVWFKVDAGTAAAIARINGVDTRPETVARRLALSARLCPTWVQTCLFRLDGQGPAEADVAAYLNLLERAGTANLQGVLLYGLARPSMQPEAARLSPLPEAELEAIGARIRKAGLTVKVSP